MITPSFGLTATERVLPKLALDFTTASLDSRITFTRALNTATRVNSSGYVETVNADVARFDYDPITLACKGLLIEESRANSIIYSDQFNQANWAKEQASVSQDFIVSPSNTQNADKLIEDSSNNIHGIYQSVAGLVDNTVYTVSVYAKAGERTKIALLILDKTGSNRGAVFDLSNGTATTGGVVPATSYSISPAGNGWYRCTVSNSVNTGAFTPRLGIYLFTTGASYAGDGTSGAYVWGAQLEAGAFPTSYIPTTTTSLTRNADVATMTGTNFSSWYNQTKGSFYSEYLRPPNSAASRTITVQNATATNSMRFNNIASSTNVNWQVVIGGATSANLATTGAAVGFACSIVGTYKTDLFYAAVNGQTPLSDTLGSVANDMDQMLIGNSGLLNSHIQKIMYWPQNLTSPETQAFSKG